MSARAERPERRVHVVVGVRFRRITCGTIFINVQSNSRRWNAKTNGIGNRNGIKRVNRASRGRAVTQAVKGRVPFIQCANMRSGSAMLSNATPPVALVGPDAARRS